MLRALQTGVQGPRVLTALFTGETHEPHHLSPQAAVKRSEVGDLQQALILLGSQIAEAEITTGIVRIRASVVCRLLPGCRGITCCKFTLSEAEQEAFIDEHFATFLDVADAKPQLVGPTALEKPQARYGHVLRSLLLYLCKTLSTQQVVLTLAGDFGLDMAIAEALLTQYVMTPGNPGHKAIDAFLAIAPDTEYREELLNTYRLLHKIAMALAKFATTADELTWLFEKGPGLGWLDLTRLPLTALTDATAVAQPFHGWERLVAIYKLRDAYAAGDATMFHMLELAHTPDTRQAVLEDSAPSRVGASTISGS